MNFTTGRPTWTWPDWRRAVYVPGLRVRHNRSGRMATYLRPSKVRHNGAIVRWDGQEETSNVVAPARDLTPARYSAWELIGFDGTSEVLDRLLGENPAYADSGYEAKSARVRLAGGRALYESVGNEGGSRVRLSRLAPELRAIVRYVDPDTELEVIFDV